MSSIDRSPITAEAIDEYLPLQEPGGIAERIKQSLAEGDEDTAGHLFMDLKAADQSIVETEADRLLEEHELDPNHLDVLKALRIGLHEGRLIGRTEGANVLRNISQYGNTSNSTEEER